VKLGLSLQKGEQRLSVFGKGVLRRIIGRKRDEVTAGWRKFTHRRASYLYSLILLG
jgi:hypothetical protein